MNPKLLMQQQSKRELAERVCKLEADNAALQRQVKGLTVLDVEGCENWLEISIVQGSHCYNCVNRDGFPYNARPTKACANFALLEAGGE